MQCYIETILIYGCESWSMTKQTLTSIEAMEMWFLRRMFRVLWTEKITNLEILNTTSSTRKLMSNVKRRQAEFLGHVMRKRKLEHVLTTGNIEGKRSRGRQRIKNTRRYSSLAGKKHCGDVCGCKRSQKGEGHDRLRLQQTRQLKKKKKCVFQYREYHAFLRLCLRLQIWGVTSYIHTLLYVWYEDCEQTYALHLHITLAVPFFINHDFIYVNTSKERKCI